ncbi:DUF4190 domain-containing protein [Falsibacillus albus]|uniref:DUF4190 domain-containing protein n=1 Tax=Falsibacillus albus TaxID=2478915 RepID=A0A3L7JY43_9BACI|nr:DUF4190 domain-containing protein [Falsibacillus albus]RLQ94601.1 DUF4190 domain-containing protein [Falsibacillus albus]
MENTETNSNSVTSLTMGILSIIIPFIGLVLGFIGVGFSRKALKEIGKTNEGGRGLATSGYVCSVIGIVLQLLAVVGYFAFAAVTNVG